MDIHYRFVASGHSEVEKAFAGIETRARASKKATEDAVRAGRGVGSTGRAGGAGPRLTEQERLGQRVAASQERAAAREVKAAERAAAAKTRAEERSRRHVAGIRDRHFAATQRLEERAERDRQRRTARGVQEAMRKEKAAKDKARREDESSHKQSIGVLKDLAGGAFLATVGTGAALIGSAAKEALGLQQVANRISISGRKPGQEARSADQLRRGFERTAMENKGVAATDVASGVAGFQALTGETDFALKLQDTFAKAALASGASVKEIAEAAASGYMHFGIDNAADMQKYLAATHFQGKAGAIEFGDAAAMYQRLAAAGAGAGIGKGVEGIKSVGGLLQTFRGGTGNREQATTAVENLFRVLKEKQTKFGQWGVRGIYDKKTGQLSAPIEEVLGKLIAGAGGNNMAKKQEELSSTFGSEAGRGMSKLVTQYMDVFNKTAGTDAQKQAEATRAVTDSLREMTNAAGDWSDLEQDAAQAQQDASAKITAAWETIKAKTGDALLPSIEALATKLSESPDALDPFIEAAGLAGEALTGLADLLKSLGLVKEPTNAQKLDKAKTALERFDAKHNGIGPLTPEDQAKRDALAAAVDTADKAMLGGGATGGKTPDGVDYLTAKPQSQDFLDAFIAYGRGTTGMALQGLGAMGLAPDNDWIMKVFGGENQAQQDIRRQRRAAELQGETAAAQPVTTDDLQKSFAAAAAAAKAAAEAMQKVGANGQGSIVTGV